MKKTYLSLFFLVFYTLSFSAVSASHEGFLLEDEKYLKKSKSGKLTCDDSAFDKVFPPCDQSSVDPSIGRILRADGLIGTGTVIESDGVRVTGITAKHVLFNEKKRPVFGEFYQGSMRVGSNTVNSLATVEIDEILTNATSPKDIALFKGKYVKKGKGSTKAKLSRFVTPVIEKKGSRRKHVKIHHYPLGVEDQRKNKGELDPTKRSTAHYVSTLPGSSGAPVLSKDGDFLVGIHTSAGTEKKKVKYTGSLIADLKNKEFVLSDSNLYADISKSELGGFSKQFKKRGRK